MPNSNTTIIEEIFLDKILWGVDLVKIPEQRILKSWNKHTRKIILKHLGKSWFLKMRSARENQKKWMQSKHFNLVLCGVKSVKWLVQYIDLNTQMLLKCPSTKHSILVVTRVQVVSLW